ncbi:hypothetical protein SteCoe_21830 [Stentor coeruleus]|uniref:Uncharacterized protein n=1 Tax=Stentor coeruleus TaxID=5963 RepID=A0A1R2BNR4_9CILI|nr:hypothetical protein SteCoe_21830 [Stentor coeruleus]
MNIGRRMITVKTPVIQYEYTHEDTPELPNISISKFKEILQNTSDLLNLKKQKIDNEKVKGMICNGTSIGYSWLHNKKINDKRKISIKKIDRNFDSYKTFYNHKTSQKKILSKLSLRYMSQYRSAELKLIKSKIKLNDLVIAERYPTAKSFYSKECLNRSKSKVARYDRLKSADR